jgi:hypothetical protein
MENKTRIIKTLDFHFYFSQISHQPVIKAHLGNCKIILITGGFGFLVLI